MNFYQLLVIFSFAIFIVVSFLSYLTRRTPRPINGRVTLPYFNLYLAMFFLILLLSAYYSLNGVRTWLWFALFSCYTIFSLFYARSETRSQRNFATASLIILSITLSSIPIIQNQGVIFGPDQWRDLEITTFIVEEGTFESAVGSGYYSFIPLFNVINAVFSMITDMPPMYTFIVMQVVYSIIVVLSIYLIVEKLSGNRLASFIAIAIFLSTPRLATIQAIPAVASLSLGTLLILFLIELKAGILYIVPLIAFTTTVIHPIGVIPILSVIIGIIVIGKVVKRHRLSMQNESYLMLMFTICSLVTIGYWSIDTRVLTGVFNPLRRLFNILTTLEYSPSVYTPQYLESGFLIYSYAWALPVALTATHILLYLLFERKSSSINRELSNNFNLSSALIALILLMISFFSILLSPGASLERYMNAPAYIMMVFSSSIVLCDIAFSRKRMIFLIGLVLLLGNIYIGTSSPSWAPFENPTFGAYRISYRGYIEARSIVTTLPTGIRVYQDNDIPIAEVASLQGMDITKDPSYQTIRKVIQEYKTNNIEYENPRIINSIVYLRTSEITDQELFTGPIDVVDNNGFHSGLKISLSR